MFIVGVTAGRFSAAGCAEKNNSTKDSLTGNFTVIGPCCWKKCPARVGNWIGSLFRQGGDWSKSLLGDTQARPPEDVPGRDDRNEPVSKNFLPVDRVPIIPSSTVMWP